MLSRLKASGNPYYQFYQDADAFRDRCQTDDPEGFEMLFSDDIEENLSDSNDQLDENMEDEMISDEMKARIDIEKQELDDEINYITNDPVRKYQFNYNESVCMAAKYPETEIADKTKLITVAPREGKKPFDFTKENDWDIKAFPHLHNPNGSNGKDEE